MSIMQEMINKVRKNLENCLDAIIRENGSHMKHLKYCNKI